MKIAWFTPFSERSAIGRCSRAITDELARRCEVDLWTKVSAEPLATERSTVLYAEAADVDLEMLRSYDMVVYNLGDHLPFHREIFEVSQQVPGIVILHDFVMHHFFAGYFLYVLRDPQAYVETMRRYYGSAGERAAVDSVSGHPTVWDDLSRVEAFPMFEPALEGALGVVVHSQFLHDRVEESSDCAVRAVPLPWVCEPDTEVATVQPPSDDRLVVLTVGHANENKRIHVVLEALGSDPELRRRVRYVVAGDASGPYAERLHQLVRQHELEDCVEILGYVAPDEFELLMRRADVCVNLRWPAMEGASASLVEEMVYGKPVIVTDTGCYREVPSDTVVKVDPREEQHTLAAALKHLVSSESLRREMGVRARAYALAAHAPSRYAAKFLEFAEEVASARPLLELADTVGKKLFTMGVAPDDPLVPRIRDEIHTLFCQHDGVLPSTRSLEPRDEHT